MTDGLVLYTNPMSRGRTARWMLEEVGVPYRTEILDFGTECAAICAYLADVFPEAELGPLPDARADYYRWLFFAAGPLEASAVDQALGLDIKPERCGGAGTAAGRRLWTRSTTR